MHLGSLGSHSHSHPLFVFSGDHLTSPAFHSTSPLNSVNRPRLIPLLVHYALLSTYTRLIRIRAIRHASALSPSRAIARHGADPLPGAAHLAAPALALAGPDVAVLLDDGLDALPDALPLAELVDAAQHVVPEVGEEQPRVVDVLVAELLLRRQAFEHQVHERRDLGGGAAVRLELRARVQRGQDGGDHEANMESISCQPEADRAADGAGDGNASERGGSEVRV